MLSFIRGLIRCSRGRHHRSEARLRYVDGQYYSNCEYCRVGMRRLEKRKWMVDRDAPPKPRG